MMGRIAVIGGGISGLMTAYLLSQKLETWVFEKEEDLGGHVVTASVDFPEGPARMDMGFMLHNSDQYPLFSRLLSELGIEAARSEMSFAFHGDRLQWCSRGLNGLLTQRGNAIRPSFWTLWREVTRFKMGALLFVENPDEDSSLQTFLDRFQFSENFREHYLYPMASALWSVPKSEIKNFPAHMLFRFFSQHGILLSAPSPWKTIPGGNSRYLEPLIRCFKTRIRTGAQLGPIRRTPDGLEIPVRREGLLKFDQAVLAVHGDQVLPLLAEPSPLEEEIFRAFRSSAHASWLHTDTSLLPPQRRAWASWNFKDTGDPDRLLLSYYMNRLQSLTTQRDVLVTMDGQGQVDEFRILQRKKFEVPRFDATSQAARQRWREVSGSHRIHYAGAYWGEGFHECGIQSALRVARCLGVDWPLG